MTWLWIVLALIVAVVGLAVLLAHLCFDDDDPDLDPNDSYK